MVKRASQQEELTCYRCQRLGLIRTQKDSKVVRNTHILEMLEVKTDQNTVRKQAREGRSLAGEVRDKCWSGHIIKVS